MYKEIKFNKYEKKGSGYHWDEISKSIIKRNIFVIARYKIVLNQIRDFKGKKILDIGRGDGALTNLISKKGAVIIGIDVSDESIKFAKEKTKNHINIDFIKASAYHLPFKNNFFDYVLCSDVIEHLLKPKKMLAEIKRVYNGKGKVIISTPLRLTKEPFDKMHVCEFFEPDFRKIIGKYFDEIQIIKSHPLIFMELQNRYHLIKIIFNFLNLLFKYNPFENTKGWRYYAMQTAVIR